MIENYIEEVLKYIRASKKSKKRIKEDLRGSLESVETMLTYDDIVDRFGDPQEMAKDFMDNLDFPNEYYGVTIGLSRKAKPYEFISKAKVLGIPIVHINTSGRYGAATAKGIIAIGDIALGVVSIGGISFGVVSLGGISAGLLAIGGISAGLLAIGGISVGHIAIGGIAVGTYKAVGAVIKCITNFSFYK